MDHFKILKRAFSITLDYRALWVFGILLALTTAGSGGGSNGGGGDGGGFNGPSTGGWPDISPQVISALIIAGIALLLVVLVLAVVGAVVRYVSETSLIRMVDQHEGAGEKLGVRQGFRLGWSRPALRIFLMDLLLGVSVTVVFLLLLLISATPLLVWLTDSVPARVLGTVLTAGLAMLVIFAGIAVSIVLSLLLQFFRRAVVLENLGVMAGMRRGLQLVRQRLGDVIVMGLILFGLGLAWVIVTIPLVIVLLIAAVVLGGLPALLVGMIVSLFTEGPTPWIVAAIVGAPIFFLVIGAPLLFLNGLTETFQSSAWTLTYRELLALESARPASSAGNDSQPEPPAEA
ncbi:MAG: hypothetical protein HYZ49_16455 [Chloroflexi bacterium]|nr:hypothetical protein [Chloroflexota bacterium]